MGKIMNAKQEAEEYLKYGETYHGEYFTIIENLLKELNATERKLAEADKVVECTKIAINNSWEVYYEADNEYDRAIPMDAYLELKKTLSDYEASKGE